MSEQHMRDLLSKLTNHQKAEVLVLVASYVDDIPQEIQSVVDQARATIAQADD